MHRPFKFRIPNLLTALKERTCCFLMNIPFLDTDTQNQKNISDIWSRRRISVGFLVLLVLAQLFIYIFLTSYYRPSGYKPLTVDKEKEAKEILNLVYQISDEVWHKPDFQEKKRKDLISEDISTLNASEDSLKKKEKCPDIPPALFGRLKFQFDDVSPTFQDIAETNPNLQPGGHYEPSDCLATSKLAVIIPHRARELHLRALLWHLHPILQRQQLYYKIYVAHQAYNLPFNKAKLMNIAFREATKDDDYDCVVFHDVDLLPEDDRLLYSCKETPKHLSVSIDKYGYRLQHMSLFGGVTMLSTDQFRDVNGFSNRYWGWGGEDDDMYTRVFSKGYTIHRPPFHFGRYKMSFHHRDKGNQLNVMRWQVLSNTARNMQEDGLRNVKYELVSIERTPIFTNITADVGSATLQCKPYLYKWTCSVVTWLCVKHEWLCGLMRYYSTDD